MELKIEIDGKIMEATMKVVGDTMVMSPKEVKFEPKDGDVLSCFFKDEYQGTFIFEEESECGEAIFHVALDADGKFIKGNGCNYFAYIYNTRPATEKEKKIFFDKLAEEGFEWKADTKELVKLKWKPMTGQWYYIPAICNAQFKVVKYEWSNDAMDVLYFGKGWAFRTKEECQEFCNRLNQAIEGIIP